MYATAADLRQRLGDLYQGQYMAVDGTPMDAEADADLAAAAAEIDSYLAIRYVVPVATPGVLPLLKQWCITLAEELAWSRSGKAEIPANVAARVAIVRKRLEDIANNDRQLPGAAELPTGASISIVESEPEVFTRNRLKGF